MTIARIVGTVFIFLGLGLSIAGVKAFPIATVVGVIFIIYSGFHPSQKRP